MCTHDRLGSSLAKYCNILIQIREDISQASRIPLTNDILEHDQEELNMGKMNIEWHDQGEYWIKTEEVDREKQIAFLNARGICTCRLGSCRFHPDKVPIRVIELKRSTRDHIMEGDW